MASPWWEASYTVITGGGRSAFVSGSGTRVVQAATAAAAAAAVVQEVPGAKVGAVNGPYATQAQAEQQQAKDSQAQAAGTETSSGGTGTSSNPKTNVNVPSPLTGLAAIGDFFQRLTQASTWIRVAKVITGGMLLIVGLVHITGIENKAAAIARKVPLPV
jgi:hypothetical protein